MADGLVMVAPATLIRIFFLLLYLPVCLITFRWLLPSLSSTWRRLATILLAAQLFVILVSLERQPSSSFEFWLWHLDREWNIPSTLASLQLALAGTAAVAAAALAKSRGAPYRLYLLAIGLLFLFLARDEYANIHEMVPHWERYYAALGAVLLATTLALAWRSPRQRWRWHGCFLAGLAISGIGSVAFEAERQICGSYSILRLDPCLDMYKIEEPLEFAGIWLVFVALLGHFSAVSPAPSRRVRFALFAWLLFWLFLLFQSGAILPITSQAVSKPAAVDFESGMRLRAYRIEGGEDDLSVHLFLSSRAWEDGAYGYSIHLIDQASGRSVASQDTFLHQRLEFLLSPGYQPVYRQWSKLTIPPDANRNRALWIALTLWREQGGEYLAQNVTASDHRLLSDSQVILDEFALKGESRQRAISPIAVFENGFALEQVEMPAFVTAGQTIDLTFSWHSSAEGTTNLAQFLHFVHADTAAQWGHDQQPLGPRLPTRLWYSGLSASETWGIPLLADLSSGEYQVFTGLYRISDQERVPASDARGTPIADARVPLGNIIVE